MNDLLAKTIHTIVAAYVKNLKEDDIKLSIMTSKLSLLDLDIYRYSLYQHEVPLIVEKGIIRSITASIPWATFFSTPTIVNIKDVQILTTNLLWKDSKLPEKDTIQSIIRHRFDAHNQYNWTAKLLLKVLSPSSISSLILKIFSKIKMVIDRINIIISFGNYSIGVKIERIIIDDFIYKTNEPIIRGLRIEGMSLYFDEKSANFDVTSNAIFFQQMNNAWSSDHTYILKKLIADGMIVGGKNMRAEIGVNEVEISVLPFQLETVLKSMGCLGTFLTHIARRGKKTPNMDNLQEMWEYVNEAASRKPQSLLEKIRIARRFDSAVSKGDNKEIEELSKETSYYNAILFKQLAEERKGRKKSRLKNINRAIGLSEWDGQEFLFTLLPNFSLKLNCVQINLKIANYLMVLYGISFESMSILGGFDIKASMTSIQLKQREGLVYTPLFESIERGKSDFNLSATFYKPLMAKTSKISLAVSAPHYTINLRAIENLSIGNIPFDTIRSLIPFIKSIKLPKINFKLLGEPFSVVLHSARGVHLVIACKCINIDGSHINLCGGELKIGDENDIVNASNIAFEADFIQRKLCLAMKPPSIDVDIGRILKLKDLIPVIPVIPVIPKIPRDLVSIALRSIPSFGFSAEVPSFDIHVRIPYTSSPAIIHMEATNFSADIKDGDSLISLNLDFEGMNLIGKFFDRLN